MQADGSALITTGNLNLSAEGAVGAKDQAIRAIIGNTLNASAANGSVNVTQVVGNLNLGTVTADNDSLRLTADGSIVNAATSDVRGHDHGASGDLPHSDPVLAHVLAGITEIPAHYGAGFTNICPIEPRSAISSVWLLK